MDVLRKFLAPIVFCSVAIAANAQQDAASVLAQILAEKGTITSQQLRQVQAAASQDRVSVLAGILHDKGVLNSADLAKLSVPPSSSTDSSAQLATLGPSSASPISAAPTSVAASSPNAEPVPKQAEPEERAEVNTGKHIPVSIYGTLLFNAGFNTAGVNLLDAGSIVTKPGSSTTAANQTYFESPRQTRFGVRLNPTELAGAALTGAFEVDAYSATAPFPDGANMGLFRLRLAYGRMDWRNVALEVGQDWSIFAPLNPSSLAMYAVAEFNGSGNPWIRLPQIRFEAKGTLNNANQLLYQIAASDPNDGDQDTSVYEDRKPGVGEFGRMPAIESRLAWTITSGDRDYTLGFSGRYGHGRNIGTIGDTTVTQGVDSWGSAVDYSLPFTHLFNLTGEAYIGRALGLYDVSLGESIEAVGTPGGHGVLSRGGWSQAQFKVTKKLEINTGYGIDQPSAYDLPAGSRFRNENIFANFIYSLTSNLEWSIEYRRLLTYYSYEPFDTGRANQATLSVAYMF